MAAINVFVSAVTTDNISRNDLIDWVNSSLSLSSLKVENLCSGLARFHESGARILALPALCRPESSSINYFHHFKLIYSIFADSALAPLLLT